MNRAYYRLPDSPFLSFPLWTRDLRIMHPPTELDLRVSARGQRRESYRARDAAANPRAIRVFNVRGVTL